MKITEAKNKYSTSPPRKLRQFYQNST